MARWQSIPGTLHWVIYSDRLFKLILKMCLNFVLFSCCPLDYWCSPPMWPVGGGIVPEMATHGNIQSR